MKISRTEANKALLIEEKQLENAPAYIKRFNSDYQEFYELSNGKLDKDKEARRIALVNNLAKMIVEKFDFGNPLLKNKKDNYVSFARNALYECASKPYFDDDAMIIIIRALYGQTILAYPMKAEHLIDGNEWVTFLERNSDNHTLKAYALALRAYIYIVHGDLFDLGLKKRIDIAQTDLIYASKWDEDNYLAYFCLGLIFSDGDGYKDDHARALENFTKAYSYHDKKVSLDTYLTKEDKERIMNNANNKIKILKK